MDETTRFKYGLYVVGMGFAILLIAMGLAFYRWTTVTDITAVISSVGTIIGTVVGAFFGLNIGAAGKADVVQDKNKAEQDRDKAQKKVELLAAAMDRGVFDQVKSQNATLF